MVIGSLSCLGVEQIHEERFNGLSIHEWYKFGKRISGQTLNAPSNKTVGVCFK